jgi:hypothetical protein
MIDIVYTGDVRSTPEVSKKSSNVFDEISKISEYQIHNLHYQKVKKTLHLVLLIEVEKICIG